MTDRTDVRGPDQHPTSTGYGVTAKFPTDDDQADATSPVSGDVPAGVKPPTRATKSKGKK